MDTFILIFGAFALALVVFAGALAIFAAFQLNAAAAYSKAFEDESLAKADPDAIFADAARKGEVYRPTPSRFEAQSGDRPGETRQEPPGALRSPLATRPPCRFCRRVRGALMNAWKAL